MQEVLAGSQDAREAFCERMACVGRLLSGLNRRLGSPLSRDELLDVSQDVLLVVWEKLDTYAGRASLETWIFRFCYLMLLKHLEKRRRREDQMRLLSREIAAGAVVSDSAGGETPAELDDVGRILRHLTRREAEVARLKYVERLEFGEIAELLGISASSAKTHCYRGLEKLRNVYGPSAGRVTP